MNVRILRFVDDRSDLLRRALPVVVGLAILVSLVAVATVVADPITRPEEFTDGQVGAEQRITAAATVQSSNQLFEPGTLLENRSQFPRRAAPVGVLRITVDSVGTGSGTAPTITTIQTSASLRISASTDQGAFYSESRSLSRRAPDPGSPYDHVVEVDTATVRQRGAAIRSVFGTVGELDASVVIETTARTDGDGPISLRTRIPLSVRENTYSFGGGTATTSTTDPVVVTEQVPDRDAERLVRQTALGLWLLAGLLFGGIRIANPRRTEFDYDRHEYRSWIAEGSLPDEEYVAVTYRSMEGLVDAASQEGSHVVYDADRRVCGFVADGILHRYRP